MDTKEKVMFKDRHDLEKVVRAKDLMAIFGYSETTAYRRMRAVKRAQLEKTGVRPVNLTLGKFAEHYGLLNY